MSCRSLNVIIWSLSFDEGGKQIRKFRIQRMPSPVISMCFDPSSTFLAMGSGDYKIRIYDVKQDYITHQFEGHTSRVTIVKFHPIIGKMLLFSVGLDGIRVWDLMKYRCIAHFNQHSSQVTGITFSNDGKQLISCARDNIIHIYDLEEMKLKRMIPTFESMECILYLNNNQVITGGEDGILKIWDIEKKESIKQSNKISKVFKDLRFFLL